MSLERHHVEKDFANPSTFVIKKYLKDFGNENNKTLLCISKYF